MGLKLDQIVPWGRSLAEYRRMFQLTPNDLHKKILDCGGGPASFNAEMTQLGHSVISCDPLYQFTANEIRDRIAATYDVILAGVKANLDNYVWREIDSPEALGRIRMAAMQDFLNDFEWGLQANRYQVSALPSLPFLNQTFDLAVCSHLLFSYSRQLSLDFHLEAMQELLRVADEVRIFPLLDVSGEPSPYLTAVIAELSSQGYRTQIQHVDYEFQLDGNQMLVVHQVKHG
ncbi:MAG TPA: SAM-dependent methyltransferase [Leptolyngbyaceae cyanobacterium M33_DOE_097]|uniref:SAM-dependent methyltransferase n=1 Tax=Oscillatoriales cyanobacterium SpSt-418 TaxID=2282169 RepID=A0A7C3KFD1_9CYAN|nr:SAM-dependent methyltransferase [Leptolyngbyaceae cyanobacterium M33_DOE_097]